MRLWAILYCLITTIACADEWQKHKAFFKEHGYLWIKDFFSDEQVKMLRSWADEVNCESQAILTLSKQAGILPSEIASRIPGALIVVPESRDPLLACRAEDMLTCYPTLFHFVSGTISSYIDHLMDEPYILFKDKINFKWPGGGAFLPHQDFPAYEFFGPREHITAMVSIDPATIENGCLYVAENWHANFIGAAGVDQEALSSNRAVLPYVVGGKEHGSIQPEYSAKIKWVALETSPRDLVLFDSYVPHYSEPNQSKASRRAMFLTHNRLREGEHRQAYYHAKRHDPDNPLFHFATPTKARSK